MSESFTDHFGEIQGDYGRFRPSYPQALFECIAGFCRHHGLAIDVGTGTGQAASGLAPYFEMVRGFDPSQRQIDSSTALSNLEFSVASAEDLPVENEAADLVTVATAAHWFNLDRFYTEVDRVLKSGGILAIWSYGGNHCDGELGRLLNEFAFEFLVDYWPMETKLNWLDKYQTLPFPYEQFSLPEFAIQKELSKHELFGYIDTWSGVKEFVRTEGYNPLDQFENRFADLWPGEGSVLFTWDLYVKVGMKA